MKAAEFPARKTLYDVDNAHPASIKHEQNARLGTLDFTTGRRT